MNPHKVATPVKKAKALHLNRDKRKLVQKKSSQVPKGLETISYEDG